MEAPDDDGMVLFGDVENRVREAPKQSAADLTSNTRKLLRGSFNR